VVDGSGDVAESFTFQTSGPVNRPLLGLSNLSLTLHPDNSVLKKKYDQNSFPRSFFTWERHRDEDEKQVCWCNYVYRQLDNPLAYGSAQQGTQPRNITTHYKVNQTDSHQMIIKNC
jgi:hypothetical protein